MFIACIYNFVSWYIDSSKGYLGTRTEFSDTDQLFNLLLIKNLIQPTYTYWNFDKSMLIVLKQVYF